MTLHGLRPSAKHGDFTMAGLVHFVTAQEENMSGSVRFPTAQVVDMTEAEYQALGAFIGKNFPYKGENSPLPLEDDTKTKIHGLLKDNNVEHPSDKLEDDLTDEERRKRLEWKIEEETYKITKVVVIP